MKANRSGIGRMVLGGITVCAGLTMWGLVPALGEDEPVVLANVVYDRIVVIGSAEAVREIGGSAQYLSPDVLDMMQYSDINRLLRLVPGVNIQEEDGFGLRPNIGMRGTGLDRSGKVAILEDGVLASPAPYAAPSAYYFPTAARMHSIEVVKGPAGIKYGPQTIGGAINFTSSRIPDEKTYEWEGAAGSDGYLKSHGSIGTTLLRPSGGSIGLLAEGFSVQSNGFKELDGGGDTGFDIEDWVGKISFETGDGANIYQRIVFKVQYSDEKSDETYLGLTDADFAANPYRRYRGSALDQMDAEHNTLQMNYTAQLTPVLDISLVGYRTDFQRNWFKLDKVLGTSISSILVDPVANAAAYDTLVGAAGFVSADDALGIKNNNRSYYAQGLQGVVGYQFEIGEAAHTLEISARLHRDAMDRFQWVDSFAMNDGKLVQTTSGVPGTDSNRIEQADAWAFFIQDQIFWGDFTLTPGVRYEVIDLIRKDYGKTDPGRTGASLSIRENSVDVVIPGIGVTYDISDTFSLLGGIHKGFANPGAGSSADAEESVNYEFGGRYHSSAISAELIGFFNDYANFVGTCTASTGGGCSIGDQFDGGAVDVKGMEAMGLIELGDLMNLPVGMPVRFAWTWTDAQFQNSFASTYGPWGTVVAGDTMPFVPEHQFNLVVSFEGEKWAVSVNANYVAEARASAGQGSIASDDRIDDRVVVDLEAEYQVTDNVGVFASVDNVFDEVYIVSRTPAGLRPGKPLSLQIGLKAKF
jgi:Fe(3+) dicitrate transport protein